MPIRDRRGAAFCHRYVLAKLFRAESQPAPARSTRAAPAHHAVDRTSASARHHGGNRQVGPACAVPNTNQRRQHHSPLPIASLRCTAIRCACWRRPGGTHRAGKHARLDASASRRPAHGERRARHRAIAASRAAQYQHAEQQHRCGLDQRRAGAPGRAERQHRERSARSWCVAERRSRRPAAKRSRPRCRRDLDSEHQRVDHQRHHTHAAIARRDGAFAGASGCRARVVVAAMGGHRIGFSYRRVLENLSRSRVSATMTHEDQRLSRAPASTWTPSATTKSPACCHRRRQARATAVGTTPGTAGFRADCRALDMPWPRSSTCWTSSTARRTRAATSKP